MNLNFEIANKRRKFLFDLLRFSVTSRVFRANANDEVHVPLFSSPASSRSLPGTSYGNLAVKHGQKERTDAMGNERLLKDTSEDSSTIMVIHLVQKKFILKHCRASVHAYTIDTGPPSFVGALVGEGYISGVDIAISLPEVEVSESFLLKFKCLCLWF